MGKSWKIFGYIHAREWKCCAWKEAISEQFYARVWSSLLERLTEYLSDLNLIPKVTGDTDVHLIVYMITLGDIRTINLILRMGMVPY